MPGAAPETPLFTIIRAAKDGPDLSQDDLAALRAADLWRAEVVAPLHIQALARTVTTMQTTIVAPRPPTP